MTIWWTDAPGATQPLLPRGADWKPCDANQAAPGIIRRMADDRPLWWARTPGPDRVIVLIGDASHSQFDVVLNGIKAGEELPAQLVCLALTGSRFHGQRQRAWTALRGNMHLTAYFSVALNAATVQPALTMIPAVAAAESITQISGGRLLPRIKWVNDIWLGDAKVAGVLTATSVSGARIDHVTFGIGMNIAATPEIKPTPFVPRAGCLGDADDNMRGALPELLEAVVARLVQLVDLVNQGKDRAVFERYHAMAGFMGAEVCVWPEGTEDVANIVPTCRGRVKELREDLSLIIDGHNAPLRTGRMAVIKGFG